MKALCALVLAGCNSILGVHDFSANDAGAPTDVPSDADPTAPCSRISMLADDFTNDSKLWTSEPGTGNVRYERVGGLLSITVPAGDQATYEAFDYYDLTDGQFSISAAGDGVPGVTVDLSIAGEVVGNAAAFHRDGMTMSFTRTIGGITTTLGSVSYNNQFVYRYLRFREAGDQLFFESSADGTSYQVLATTDAVGLGFVLVQLSISNTTTTTYVETLDDANGGVPSGTACPIAMLADDFDSGSLVKFAHRVVTGAGTVVPENGAVRISPGMMNGGGAGLLSSTVYDARDAGFELEVKEMFDTPLNSGTAFAIIMLSAEVSAEFYVGNEIVNFELGTGTSSATPIGSIAYDATAMRWMRFRTTADAIAWELSPDGTTWTEMANSSVPSGLDRMRVYVVAVSLGATPNSALIDNARVP